MVRFYPPAVLLIAATGLTLSAAFLLFNMKKYFEKELEDEAKKIAIIFVVLTVTSISRAVASLLQTGGYFGYHSFIVYLTHYFIWDIVPLLLIMLYHKMAFNDEATEKVIKRQTVDQTMDTDFDRATKTTQSSEDKRSTMQFDSEYPSAS